MISTTVGTLLRIELLRIISASEYLIMNDERTTDAVQLFLDILHRDLDAESALASTKARILIHQL